MLATNYLGTIAFLGKGGTDSGQIWSDFQSKIPESFRCCDPGEKFIELNLLLESEIPRISLEIGILQASKTMVLLYFKIDFQN